jgi:hypothetical protein
MAEEQETSVFKDRARNYAEILNVLFDPTPFMASERLFEFVCVLTRPGGIHGPDWDPWHESQAILDDLGKLATLDLPKLLFPNPDRTRVRLSLLSYCHLTEMNFPYALLANLLRLQLGRNYDMTPFRDLYIPIGKKETGPFQRIRPPSPGKKIGRIKQLANEAQLPKVGEALDSIYDRIIRNAVYHSDYTLSTGELRLRGEYRLSKKRNHSSQVVEWDELSELFTDTFAFYTALFLLYERCRKSFGDFRFAFIPFDGHYKGVLQLLFDIEERLAGFRIYWPNASVSEYQRIGGASTGVNLHFNPDGSINFMVGLYASKPGQFSPLVEHGGRPRYAEIPGTCLRPHWPDDLRVYQLDLASRSKD